MRLFRIAVVRNNFIRRSAWRPVLTDSHWRLGASTVPAPPTGAGPRAHLGGGWARSPRAHHVTYNSATVCASDSRPLCVLTCGQPPLPPQRHTAAEGKLRVTNGASGVLRGEDARAPGAQQSPGHECAWAMRCEDALGQGHGGGGSWHGSSAHRAHGEGTATAVSQTRMWRPRGARLDPALTPCPGSARAGGQWRLPGSSVP